MPDRLGGNRLSGLYNARLITSFGGALSKYQGRGCMLMAAEAISIDGPTLDMPAERTKFCTIRFYLVPFKRP